VGGGAEGLSVYFKKLFIFKNFILLHNHMQLLYRYLKEVPCMTGELPRPLTVKVVTDTGTDLAGYFERQISG
jgi:hypothetical protein